MYRIEQKDKSIGPGQPGLKVALQILRRKFYKNTRKSSLYSKSLLIYNDKTPVVENHPTTREIKRFTMAQVDTDGKRSLFLREQLVHLHTGNTQTKLKHSVR